MNAAEFLQIAGGIASIVAALGVVVGALGLRATAKARKLDAWIAYRELVNSERAQRARRFVMRDLPRTYVPAEIVDPATIDQIETVTLTYQAVGHMLWLGLVTEDEIIPETGLAAMDHWVKLLPWIEFLRSTRPNQRVHFEYLVQRADRYIRRRPKRMVPPRMIDWRGLTQDDLVDAQAIVSQAMNGKRSAR